MPSHSKKLVGAGIAILLLAQLMLAQVMAASPDFHDECHHHDHRDGESLPCVVDLMLSSGYGFQLPSITPLEVPPGRPIPGLTVAAPSEIVPDHFSGLLDHAPPRGP